MGVDWKGLTGIVIVLIICVAFQLVLGVQKSEPTGIENLYVNKSRIEFHNNRAIVGIKLDEARSLLNNDYLVVRAVSPLKVDINSNLQDCTNEYSTFEYRVKQKMMKDTNFEPEYRIYCLDGNKKPVIGLHHSGKGEFYGSIEFEVYRSANGKLTPGTRKIFEKKLEFG